MTDWREQSRIRQQYNNSDEGRILSLTDVSGKGELRGRLDSGFIVIERISHD